MSASSLATGGRRPVPPQVAIVLLNWNGYADTRRCLESLAGATYPRRTTYLADNGSTDGSMDRLEVEFGLSGIVFIRNGENLGFSAGCNRAIRRALDDGCDYVLLLNNDCIVAKADFLEAMVTLAEADPRVGLVGGKLLRWPDTSIIWETGGWISWAGERFVGFGEPDRGQHDQIAERGFISGALMLIRREILERIGLLPEEYFFGHEDWEYGIRVRRLGFRLMYQPKAVVHHQAEHSFEPARPYYLFNATLSKILFKKRTLSRISFRVWLATYSFYLRVLMPLIARLKPGRYRVVTDPGALRRIMLAAVAEAPGLDRVTPALLERFREASGGAGRSAPGRSASPSS
jgi:GT2 family glycosyltransferase